MNKLIAAFLFFFLVFAVIGYLDARRHQQTDDYAKLFIISHLDLIDDNGRCCVLVYKPKGQPLWFLYLHDNRSAFADLLTPLTTQTTSQFTAVPISKEVIIGFLGGAAGAWNVKDVVSALQKEGKDFQKVIAAIVGSTFGYSVGFWVGNRQDPPYLSSNITRILSDAKSYPEIKRLAFLFLFKERLEGVLARTYLEKDKLDEKQYTERAILAALVSRARDPNYEFSNDDFHHFFRFTK